MSAVMATLIILAIIALGEVFSIISRAKIPTLLVVVVVFFTLLQIGVLPKDILAASTFTVIGAVLQPAILVHMGTLIPLKVMKQQYKSVIITLIGITISCIMMLAAVPIFFDYETTVAGAGPLTGGIIAYLVTAEGLQAQGLTALVAIPAIILSLQQLIGMPLSSWMLRRYGMKLLKDMDENKVFVAATVEDANRDEEEPAKRKSLFPEKLMDSHFFVLFLLFIGSALAVWLGELTGISYSLFGLAIGILGSAIGFFPEKALERSNGFSIAMIGLIFVVMESLVDVTVADILAVLPAVSVILIIGTIGLLLGGFLGSKLFKWDYNKGIPVVLTAMYGFPGDYLITQEVGRSVGRNKEEEAMIMNQLLPPMLMGGFASVSIGSVVIASILIQTL
ncbi:hypothetical protein [Terribacillus sp. 7520-G]|uniref:hypothetical protein n=1 Tax=Terribacillus sp. 7520-G TaxID=2025389 RepID=UPI000BA59252|nr:hypothetical protein [Terribacillus sp. 7520-G]PAD39768.1 hypothetical protein CHH53_04505 [Terribacillus sp. 7520-G]